MKQFLLFGGFIALLAVGIGAAVSQHNTVAALQQENQELLKQKVEMERLLTDNSQLPQLREENQLVQQLRTENHDLFKLRNEIGKLRNQRIEMDKLRVENERLVATQKGSSPTAASQPALPGYIPKNALVNAGKSTPAAALQTFFWAASHADAIYFKDFPGFAIVEQQVVSEKDVILKIQASPNGEKFPIRMRRVSEEWKLLDF